MLLSLIHHTLLSSVYSTVQARNKGITLCEAHANIGQGGIYIKQWLTCMEKPANNCESAAESQHSQK